ncbi:hypothetical protein C2845_PM06G26650 [Panicum miliaceum]|uniref:Uncharacterized protein n=1 Tax=Panicum miliaceum TaxID=4540 RepID=A0A3L6R4S0_PANMI|nr:hypothetical protein C2845_PM06G26650 [Panicum miliaceum]
MGKEGCDAQIERIVGRRKVDWVRGRTKSGCHMQDNAPKGTSTDPSEQLGADDGTHSGNNGGESSGTKPPPSKKQKITTDDDLVVMISQSLGELCSSIKKLAEPDLAAPNGFYAELKSIRGFDEAHLDHYYAYLCDNPPLARAFYALPNLSSKIIWVARYIKNHLSERM